MSQQDLTQFLEAVRQDSSLQEKLRQSGADPVAIAREAGFTLTQAEMIRAQAQQIGKLSDEELENIAGGTWSPLLPPQISASGHCYRQPI